MSWGGTREAGGAGIVPSPRMARAGPPNLTISVDLQRGYPRVPVSGLLVPTQRYQRLCQMRVWTGSVGGGLEDGSGSSTFVPVMVFPPRCLCEAILPTTCLPAWAGCGRAASAWNYSHLRSRDAKFRSTMARSRANAPGDVAAQMRKVVSASSYCCFASVLRFSWLLRTPRLLSVIAT